MGSFSYLAAVIVENERPRESVVKDVIAKGVLHDFVLETVGLDEAFLWLEYVKFPVIAGLVGALAQFVLQIGDGLECVQLYLGDGVLPSLSPARGPVGFVKVPEVANLIEILLAVLLHVNLPPNTAIAPGPSGYGWAPGRRCHVFVLGVAPLDGIFIPLMGGPLLSAAGTAVYLVAVFHQSRAHAVVAVVRVVVVAAPVRVHVAHVVRVRRVRGANKAHKGWRCTYNEYPNETRLSLGAKPRCILLFP